MTDDEARAFIRSQGWKASIISGIIPHSPKGIPDAGSYEVKFGDGRPSVYSTGMKTRGAGRSRAASAKRPPSKKRKPQAAGPWSRHFREPIPIPGREPIKTLLDAGLFIDALSDTEKAETRWQDAVEALMLVVELNGPTEFARIGMMRALSGPPPREPPTPKRRKKPAKRFTSFPRADLEITVY